MKSSLNLPSRPVIFVLGSTASGKSALALRWAEESGGEILNADSLQIYRELNVGTAKPSTEDFARAPHHLFDIATAPAVMNAGDYRRAAIEKIQTLQNLDSKTSSSPIFIVGGSGFYVQALRKGMFESPKASAEVQARLKARFQSEGLESLHAELAQHDPETARVVHVNDKYRIQRALEVFATTGKALSQIRKEFLTRTHLGDAFPYSNFQFGIQIPREQLRERIIKRTHRMLENGLIEEVRGLLAQGLSTWTPLQSVGYKETHCFLKGELSKNELFDLIVTHTQQLAKRQMTWFKRDPSIHWLHDEKMISDLSWKLAFAIIREKQS